MITKNKLLTDEQIDGAIEAAYAPLHRLMLKRIKVILNPELRKIYHEYRQTAKSVKKLRAEKCPDYLLDGLQNETKSLFPVFFERVSYSQLAFTGLTMFLLALMTFYNLHEKGAVNRPLFQKAQAMVQAPAAIPGPEKAVAENHTTRETRPLVRTNKGRKVQADSSVTEQVKESLAFVAEVLVETDQKIQENGPFEIVQDQLNKSLKAVNKLLIGGKNEI